MLDPLHGVRHRSARRGDKSPRPEQPFDTTVDKETSEKLMRERSIRTNRRHKFVDCLSGQDVNIGRLLDPTVHSISFILHSQLPCANLLGQGYLAICDRWPGSCFL